jgi:hypothetical protein
MYGPNGISHSEIPYEDSIDYFFTLDTLQFIILIYTLITS